MTLRSTKDTEVPKSCRRRNSRVHMQEKCLGQDQFTFSAELTAISGVGGRSNLTPCGSDKNLGKKEQTAAGDCGFFWGSVAMGASLKIKSLFRFLEAPCKNVVRCLYSSLHSLTYWIRRTEAKAEIRLAPLVWTTYNVFNTETAPLLGSCLSWNHKPALSFETSRDHFLPTFSDSAILPVHITVILNAYPPFSSPSTHSLP